MQVSDQFEVNAPINVASVVQVFKKATDLDVQLSTTIAGNTTASSLPIQSCGYKLIAIGLTSTQNATISVQRYIDTAGTIPQDGNVPITLNLTANTPASFNILDAKPFGSFVISIQNTSSSSATISPFILMLQAN